MQKVTKGGMAVSVKVPTVPPFFVPDIKPITNLVPISNRLVIPIEIQDGVKCGECYEP